MKVSVVIPTYNGEKKIRETLEALSAQDHSEYEIIVVNDGSTDQTEKIIKELQKEISQLRIVTQENQGPGRARNRGVEEAKGEIIAFTDDDCVPERKWLRKITEMFKEDKKIGIIGGTYLPDQKENTWIDRWQRSNTNIFMESGLGKKIHFFETNNMAIRKDIFKEVGGFNLLFGGKEGSEDIDLNYKVLKKGYHLILSPEARLKHKHKENLKGLLKRAHIAGSGDAMFMLINPEKKTFRPYQSFITPILALRRTMEQRRGIKKREILPFYLLNLLTMTTIQAAKITKSIKLKKPELILYRVDKNLRE